MTELEAWRDLYGSLRERDALMVAIGPQIAAAKRLHGRAARTSLPGSARTPDNAVAEQFGLVYTVPEYHRNLLPLDPGEHSVREWREELAAALAGNLRDRRRTGRSSLPRRMPTFACGRSRKRRSLRRSLRRAAKGQQQFRCLIHRWAQYSAKSLPFPSCELLCWLLGCWRSSTSP